MIKIIIIILKIIIIIIIWIKNNNIVSRLVPVVAISWTGEFNAGYSGDLDTTAVELPLKE